MHVMVVLDAIKKRGTFKESKKAQKTYVEANRQLSQWRLV
jgi:hypothetical protein